MNSDAKKYLYWLTGAVLIGAVCVAGWNARVDPYGIYRHQPVQGFNHFRFVSGQPAERMIKAHELNRDTSPGLLLGTSRVDWGLAPDTAAAYTGLSGFYNAGLGGCTIYEAYRYLQHAHAQFPRKRVVLGLDIEMFNTTLMRDPDLNRRLAVHESGCRNLFYRTADVLPTLYSLSAIQAGRKTMEKSREYRHTAREELERRGGAFQEGLIPPEKRLQAFQDRRTEAWENFGRLELQQRLIDLRMAYFEALVDFAHRENIQLDMFITPYHFTLIGMITSAGNWPAFARWKQELWRVNTEAAARYHRPPFPIWDFSPISDITRDRPPSPKNPNRIMKYYIECSHYRKRTGDLVLARIFDAPEAVAGFGVPLADVIGLERRDAAPSVRDLSGKILPKK